MVMSSYDFFPTLPLGAWYLWFSIASCVHLKRTACNNEQTGKTHVALVVKPHTFLPIASILKWSGHFCTRNILSLQYHRARGSSPFVDKDAIDYFTTTAIVFF